MMTTTFVTGLRLMKQARCASRALACPSDSKSAGCATAEALTSLGAAGKKYEPADVDACWNNLATYYHRLEHEQDDLSQA